MIPCCFEDNEKIPSSPALPVILYGLAVTVSHPPPPVDAPLHCGSFRTEAVPRKHR